MTPNKSMQSEGSKPSLLLFLKAINEELAQIEGAVNNCKSKHSSPIHKEKTDFGARQWDLTEFFHWVWKMPIKNTIIIIIIIIT